MSTELLKQVKSRFKTNLIGLGTMNGWGKETSNLYKELSEHRIQGSQKDRNLGRCYNEYQFDVLIENEKFTVVYSIDSGD